MTSQNLADKLELFLKIWIHIIAASECAAAVCVSEHLMWADEKNDVAGTAFVVLADFLLKDKQLYWNT